MFIYTDFKDCLVNKRYEDAKAMLSDGEIEIEPFNAMAEAAMFLSLIFRYPSEEVWQTLNDNWDSFRVFFEDYITEVPSLYDSTEMQSDFIILFKQDFKGKKIVPYISYYTEDKKLLYGESTFRIREWMACEGFELDKEAAELEDNVYLVLEFMSSLFRKLANPESMDGWYATLGTLFSLLETYGKVISDEFAVKVADRADMPFYAACAKLLGGFIKDVDPILEDVFSSVS